MDQIDPDKDGRFVYIPHFELYQFNNTPEFYSKENGFWYEFNKKSKKFDQISGSKFFAERSQKEEAAGTNQSIHVSTDDVSNPTSVPSTCSRETKIESEANCSKPEKIKKRAGTVDSGKKYECMSIAYLIITLLGDDHVIDFKINNNDPNFGMFDDIVLEVTKKSGVKQNFAIQLKHTDNKKIITKAAMENDNSIFSISKYFNDYLELKKNKDIENYNLILHTTCNTHERWDGKINLGEDLVIQGAKVRIPLAYYQEAATKCVQKTFEFSIKSHNSALVSTDSKYTDLKNFLEKFRLCVGQPQLKPTEQLAIKDFKNNFLSDQFKLFYDFIENWCNSKETDSLLTKQYVSEKLAECLLSPYIRVLEEKPTNQYGELLRRAVNKFNATFLDANHGKNIEILSSGILEGKTDQTHCNKILRKFNITQKVIQNINELNPIELKKLLWHMDKFPLVIDLNRSNHCEVDKAVQLCSSNDKIEKKFIFLKDSKDKVEFDLPFGKTFRHLEDLASIDQQLYEEIREKFKISLQGKEAMSLKIFAEDDTDLKQYFTPNELIQNVEDNQISIGRKEDVLEFYVNRHLTHCIIDLAILRQLSDENIAIIYCDDHRDFKQRFKHLHIIQLDTNTQKLEKNINIFTCPSAYSLVRFRSLFQPEKSIYHHLFKCCKDKDSLEWIESNGNIDLVNKYRNNNATISELEIIQTCEQPLNLVCAEPGMGKTAFLKYLQSNYDPRFWVVRIEPKNHNLFESEVSLEAIKDLLFCLSTESRKEEELLQVLYEKRQIILLWDGLDEVSNKKLPNILDAIDQLRKSGLSQWITSRTHLQKDLEKRFNILSRSITKFDEEQQNKYIVQRLENKYIDEKLEEVVSSVLINLKVNRVNELFGIPLQIYMLTELLLNEESNFLEKLKQNTFSIAVLYEHFIEGKFKFYNKDKLQLEEGSANDQLKKALEENQEIKIETYEKAALITCLEPNIIKELDSAFTKRERLGNFENDYQMGIIIGVSENKIPIFIHMTFAEFLVAKYFYHNFPKLNQDWWFLPKYNNIRFFFDILTAGKSEIHLAVLYKDEAAILNLVKNMENPRQCKDLRGRNPLLLASSWGTYHPILPHVEKNTPLYNSLSSNNPEAHVVVDYSANSFTIDQPSAGKEIQIIDALISVYDCTEHDSLFLFTAFHYANKTHSLISLNVLVKKEVCELKMFVGSSNLNSIIYYAIRFHYDHLIRSFNEYPNIVTISDRYDLVQLAAKHNDLVFLEEFAKRYSLDKSTNYYHILVISAQFGNLEAVKYLMEKQTVIQGENVAKAVEVASQKGHLDVVKYLVENGANVTGQNGMEAVTVASQMGHLNVVKYLVENGVNIQGQNGAKAVTVASDMNHLDVLKYLVDKGANVQDQNGTDSVTMASIRGHLNVVKYLVENGANVQGRTGTGAVTWASKGGYLNIVKYLVENGANVQGPNSSEAVTMASWMGHLNVVKYLVEHGANVQGQNSAKAVTKASQMGHLEVVKYLVENGANVRGQNGTEAVTMASNRGHLNVVKYLVEHGANGQGQTG